MVIPVANGYDQHSLAHADSLRTRKRPVSALSPLDDPRETVNAASSALTEVCVRESARTAGMPASEAITSLREATKSGSSSGGNPFAKGGALNKDTDDDEDDEDDDGNGRKKRGSSRSSSGGGSSSSGSSSSGSSGSSKSGSSRR